MTGVDVWKILWLLYIKNYINDMLSENNVTLIIHNRQS